MDNILIQAVVAAMFAKVLVDAVKTTPLQTVGWVLVVLAFLFGELSAFLVPLATVDNLVMTHKVIANNALVGILAGGSAIGVTELQKFAETRKNGDV
jgi:hypothetical protein